MEDTISQAKAEYDRAKNRLKVLLATTPQDKLNWSPGPTARTPLQIAAHATLSTTHIKDMLRGEPLPFTSVAELEVAARAEDTPYNSLPQVLELIEKTGADYCAWLDTLTPEQVGSTVDIFFGSFPMAMAITFPADHMRGHNAQIEYLQTTWGDRDWHMG